MKNTTAYLTAPRTLEIRDSAMPALGPDDLMIRVKHVGVCGSDLAYYEDVTKHGTRHADYPVVLGHECAGEVVDVGARVTGFAPGDRVAVEPGVPCMKCDYCVSGRYNLCDRMNFMATAPWERAALSEYIAHPAMMCFKLPANVSTMEGALVEPLAVGMHAATRAGAGPGATALIIGSGCIGLCTLLALRARGVSTIYSADLYELRLTKAKAFGAAQTINASREDTAETVARLTGGRGVDIVFEAAGDVDAAIAAQKCVKKGGKLVIIGNIHENVPVGFMNLASHEVDIIGIFRYRNLYPTLVEALAGGIIDIRPICTDLYPFREIQRGFDDAYERKMEVVKAVIEI